MNRLCALIGVALVASAAGFAQTWDSKRVATFSPEDATARYAKIFPGPTTLEIKSGVDLYKLRYRAHDGNTKVHVSGLLALPHNGAPKGLVIFFMGFTTDRRNSPSLFATNKNPALEAVVLAFCIGGYAVAIPDTFGLGDDKRAHPYTLGSVNCQAGIDMIDPAREAARKANVNTGPKLFVTGYSEGGGMAMWMVRKLERLRMAGFAPDMAAPMAGPYDMSGTMAKWIVAKTPDAAVRGFKFVASAYIALGIQSRTPGLKLNDYFIPSFASYIPFVYKQTLTEEELGKKMLLKGTQLGALLSTERVLTPRFRNALKYGDSLDPVMRAMKDNDSYNWQPRTKMLLPYVPGDQIIPDENTKKAAKIMEPTGNVRAISLDPGLDHVTGFVPGLVITRRFFDGGFAGVELSQSAVTGTATYRERIAMPPNAELTVRLEDVPRAGAPAELIAESKTRFGDKQVPIPFTLPYDAARILPGRRYAIRATIGVDGQMKFTSTRSYPVLTNGAPNRVEMLMEMVRPGGEAGFVDKVWRVSESLGVAPGQLYVFLSEGTLVIASPNGTPSLGTWKYEGGALTMTEEGISRKVDILTLTNDVFKIRIHSPGEPLSITLVPAKV
ncbi:MAG: YbaY family lipoprotein [Armatimonadetes bacterium]|nr:YbaY family lipoprotein [Armatimonadota bacterium]